MGVELNWLSTALLACVGIVMSYSTTAPLSLSHRIPPLFLKHLSSLMIGVIAAVAAGMIPLARWQRAALPLWLAGVVLLLLAAGKSCATWVLGRWRLVLRCRWLLLRLSWFSYRLKT